MAHQGRDPQGHDARYSAREPSRGTQDRSHGDAGRGRGQQQQQHQHQQQQNQHQPQQNQQYQQPNAPRHVPADRYPAASTPSHAPVTYASYGVPAQTGNVNQTNSRYITEATSYEPTPGSARPYIRPIEHRDPFPLSMSQQSPPESNNRIAAPSTGSQQYPEVPGPFSRGSTATNPTITPERSTGSNNQPKRSYHERSTTTTRTTFPDHDNREDQQKQTVITNARVLDNRPDNMPARAGINSTMGPTSRQPGGEELDSMHTRPMGAPPRTSSFSTQPNVFGNDTSSLRRISDGPSIAINSKDTIPIRSRDPAPQVQFRHLLPVSLRDFAAITRNDLRGVATYALQNPKILEADSQLFLNEAIRAYAFGKSGYGDSLVQQAVIIKKLQLGLSDGQRRNPKTYFQKLLAKERGTADVHFQDFDKAQSAAREKARHTSAADQPPPRGPGAPEVDGARAPAADGHSRPQLQPQRTKSGQDVGELNITRYPSAPNPSATGANSRFGPEPQNPSTQALGLPNNGLDVGAHQPSSRALGPVPREQQTQQQRPPTASAINPQAPGPIPPSRVNDENDELGRLPAEGLDPRFLVRDSHFYRVGRVFSLIWHENLSETAKVAEPSRYTYTSRGAVSTGRFGQKIYTTARRMVVVRAGKGFCVCIQINTYAGRGLAKFRRSNEDVQAHSRIYMDDTQPVWLPDEPRSEKKSIAVRKSKPEQRLEAASRLCYSRPHTVDHTVKSMDVGLVHGQSLQDVLYYYAEINNIT